MGSRRHITFLVLFAVFHNSQTHPSLPSLSYRALRLPVNMMGDRVHPDSLPIDRPSTPATDLSDSPRSSTSSAQNFMPKPPPPSPSLPLDYIIHVEKDQILRVPPPENAHRMGVYSRRAAARRRRNCLAWIALPFIFLLLLAAAATGVLYVVYRPSKPVFSIYALSVNGFNLSSSSLAPELVATVRAENPNKKLGIYYRLGSDLTASYGGVNLCRGVWPVFFQEGRNLTVLKTALTGSVIRLSSAMNQQLVTAQDRRQVPLLIDSSVPVQFKVGAVKSWTLTLKIRCDVTVDGLTAASTVVSQSCKVEVKI